jgi:hypothetical protein
VINRWQSTPLDNYFVKWTNKQSASFTGEMFDVLRAPAKSGLKPVSFMKKLLGKQDYCWNGEFRFWVWQQGDWRVYVSNTKGICFEVREFLSYGEVIYAWNDFRMKIGIL